MVLKNKEVLQIEFDNIPSELTDIPMWVMWKSERKLDKNNKEYYTKVPYETNGMYKASVSDSATWCTFDEAREAFENGIGSGIGLIINNSHDVYVLDIDNTTDSKYYDYFSQATYCETSPSGNGYHVYMIGDKPKAHMKKNSELDIELFSASGFVTVTGHQTNDVDTVSILDDHIDNLIEQAFKAQDQPAVTLDYTSPEMSDDEVIALCEKANNSDKFKALYHNGDISAYDDDESRADAGLASILAFYTQNVAQIERIMRRSALYREKWDRREKYPYLNRTIDNVINKQSERYKKPSEGTYIFLDGDIQNFSMEDLKKTLKQLGHEEIARLRKDWEDIGKNGAAPSKISAPRCGYLLMQHVPFILLDNKEGSKIAMYDFDQGIYTRNRSAINRVIHYLEPKFNENQANNVVYFINNQAPIKEPTNSRYLIPVNNGVFNLKTKTLEPFSPEYVFTSKVNTDYVENPENPVIDGWDVESWIDSIACDDVEVTTLLWQVINDSLNGNYSRGKALFLVGEGANGKGTYQELIINLLGIENIAPLTVKEFDPKEHKFRLASLDGVSAVIGDDNNERLYMDDISNFKRAITGDILHVEEKNKKPYPIFFKGAVIQSTNDMPKFRASNHGVYRRIIIVPFNADFTGDKENRKIKDEYIKDEKVLQYVLHKAVNMDFEKFTEPDSSAVALEEFKDDNDPVYSFVYNEFLPRLENVDDVKETNHYTGYGNDPHVKKHTIDKEDLHYLPKSFIYQWYRQFCSQSGVSPLANNTFFKQMSRYISDKYETDKRIAYHKEAIRDFTILGRSLDMDYGQGIPNEGRRVTSFKKKDI